MDDRRSHPRFGSSTIMQFKDGFFSASIDTVTKDVSVGGVCFFSDKKVAVGRVVTVKLYYDSRKGAKKVTGRVVWSKPYEDKASKGYLNGLMFIS
jgi:hypothetical protein